MPSEPVFTLPILINRQAGRRTRGGNRRLSASVESERLPGELLPVRGDRIGDTVDRLLRAGHPRIAVSGGDGSIASAANRLAGTETVLLPIPTGTLNHFSRRLGIATVGMAVRANECGRVEEVPIGVVDDRIFLNTATFGIYADVVSRRERLRRVLTKWPAAAVASLWTLSRLRTLDVGIQVEGEYLRRSTALLWVGIGWGSFPRVTEAPEKRTSPDLEIVVLHARTRLGAVALAARLVRHLIHGKRPIDDPALEVIHARSLTIHTRRSIGITLDGEVVARGNSPIYVAIQDAGLRVVCGRMD